MEFVEKNEINELANPGVVSKQLLNSENPANKRLIITEIHLAVGASQPMHTQDSSERIWYATQGTGKLLLINGQQKELKTGDVMRFPAKDVRALLNDGNTELVYLSVTASPTNSGYAYQEK